MTPHEHALHELGETQALIADLEWDMKEAMAACPKACGHTEDSHLGLAIDSAAVWMWRNRGDAGLMLITQRIAGCPACLEAFEYLKAQRNAKAQLAAKTDEVLEMALQVYRHAGIKNPMGVYALLPNYEVGA